jgi:RNA polymerase sigma-70 factor (ECF subfamily)
MESIEAAAIRRVRNGDSDAFRFLVDSHSRALFRLAYRLTRNEHDADDVVQETFLRAYKHLETFDSRASLSTWLHRIAANSAIDLMRRRERDRGEELDEATMEAKGSSGDHSMVMRMSVTAAVDQCMKEMTGRERMAFVLRHYEGMSIDEIGSVLGTEVNATKNTIFRAVKKLRQFLEPLVRTT